MRVVDRMIDETVIKRRVVKASLREVFDSLSISMRIVREKFRFLGYEVESQNLMEC